MPDFKEELLQFIWRHRLLKPLPLHAVSGNPITILKQGELNRSSGPDFFSGQIRIGDDLVLAGNIELHLRSSDWLRHGHQDDPAYDNIILHAVFEHDQDIPQNTMFGVEVLELKHYIDPATLDQYEELSRSAASIPCSKHLSGIPDLKYISWLERMTVERLEVKTNRVRRYFQDFRGDYSQVFYCLLTRSLGFSTNAEPFEMLARQLPVHLLLKHADDIEQLECLLLGFAGMLDEQYEDEYIRRLQNLFEFNRRKYGLVPLSRQVFKFSGMRPANFPTLRLAQLAAIIHRHPALFSAPHHFAGYGDLIDLLRTKASDYWQKKFLPDGRECEHRKGSGRQSAESLVVNAFAPFFFFYGTHLNKQDVRDASLDLMNRCAAENNVKTRLYDQKKDLHVSAAVSQGLIHLHDQYCRRKQCLHCGLAATFLRSA